LVADIVENSDIIGRIIIQIPESQGVTIGPTNIPVASLTLDQNYNSSLTSAYSKSLTAEHRGVMLYRNATDPYTLDERMLGPSHLESLGALRETPGVGWQENNKLLLSYAAGDTVGEASRWFHTYTFVNLGDPVTHVDPDAS
jgi:hypothetical protein